MKTIDELIEYQKRLCNNEPLKIDGLGILEAEGKILKTLQRIKELKVTGELLRQLCSAKFFLSDMEVSKKAIADAIGILEKLNKIIGTKLVQ